MTTSPDSQAAAPRDARTAIAENPLWYHTIEVAPDVVTPGWFDLRPVVDGLPWPEVGGRRCLDVGTYDGFLAFELERRGAGEVVATDIQDHDRWDWPAWQRARGPKYLAQVAGEKGRGFEIAAELLGSRVRKTELSVYELSPETVGTFDVVVCGSLLLHLRDPVGALEAMRSVCDGWFLSADEVDFSLSRRHRRSAVARFDGTSGRMQWWLPNAQTHRQMLEAAGFAIERGSAIYTNRYGPAHPVHDGRRPLKQRMSSAKLRLFAGGDGVPHQALLARPAI